MELTRKEYHNIIRQIKRNGERIAELRMTGLSSRPFNYCGGGSHYAESDTERRAIKIAEIQDENARLICRQIDFMRDLDALCRRIPDEQQATAYYLHILDALPMRERLKALQCSRSQYFQLVRAAAAYIAGISDTDSAADDSACTPDE